jgi:hypothetical protein
MAFLGLCPACKDGNHAAHIENFDPLTPAQIASGFCRCKGECVDPIELAAKLWGLD